MKYLLTIALFALTGCPAQPPEVSYPEAAAAARIDRVLNATVALVEDTGRTFCSGVLNGTYILTAAHCVEDLEGTQSVAFRQDRADDGWLRTYEYSRIHYDDTQDLAILAPTVSQSPAGGLQLSPESPLTGDKVIVVGHPLGLLWSVNNGIVSHPLRKSWGMNWLQISADVSPGNSGGPVLNEYGEIVGLVSFYLNNGFQGQNHLAGAVHLSEIKAALGQEH